MSNNINDQLVLVCGRPAAGKSASFMNFENPAGVMYLNCEAGKRLPFRSKFKEFTIVDPLQIEEAFTAAEGMPEVHTIIVDSLTYLMEMFESVYVVNSANTMKAWGDYNQYFKRLMQNYVAKSTKNVVFTAHVNDELNENDMVMETSVPVKGALKRQGVESYFSCILTAKKVQLKKLADYQNDLLDVTDEQEALGFKYVFQTKLTKDTVNERIRGPLGLWTNKETFIDNDMQKVFNRLHEYYS